MKEDIIEEKNKEEIKEIETKKILEETEKEAPREDSKNEEKPKENVQKEKKTKDNKEQNERKHVKTKFEKVEEKPKKLEKEMKKMNNKKSKKKYFVLASILGVIIILGIFLSTVFALVNINNEKMMSGIFIAEIDVSGLSKEETKAKLETIYNEKKEKEINIKYQDYESTLNPTLMEVNYKIEEAVEEAYKVGRRENIFFSNYDILFALIAKKNINVEMNLNEDVTKQTIQDISANLPGVLIESSYSVEEDELIITKGKSGILVDADKLYEKVKERLNDINAKEDFIEIPVVEKEPEEIDIQKIHDEIYQEAKDAYYTKEPFTIYPEVKGIDFDVEEAKTILSEEKEEYVIKLKITKPKVTIDKIGSEAFPDQLSTFTTRYDVSDVNRTTNLVIACQKINGKVLMPGETFSYNKALGPRTVAAGYRNGKIYAGGEVVDGIGGGICQISSTLYNTVLLANLDVVERRNHQFVTSYVGPGRDATVVYGVTDFKFKNTRKYPVRIVASARNGIATISMYGIKEENEYTFKFSTRTVASIPTTTKYVDDASLPVGTERVKQKGTTGIKTETYITKMLNGKVISTKLLSKDTYNAMVRIVLRGTKAVNAPTTPPSTNVPVTEEPKQPEIPTKPEDGGTEETPPTDGGQETEG